MADRKRILLVDDSPDPYQRVLDSIRDEFDLTIMRTLDEALRFLSDRSKQPPDCLLLDGLFKGSLPAGLAEFATGARGKLLYGQLLPLWMRDRRLSIPYVFLTFAPNNIDIALAQDDPSYRGIIVKDSERFAARNANRTIAETFGFHMK